MGENKVKALEVVNFRIKNQEFVAIIGKRGPGKNMFLHMLGGLDKPTEGEVLIEGRSLCDLKKGAACHIQKKKDRIYFSEL